MTENAGMACSLSKKDLPVPEKYEDISIMGIMKPHPIKISGLTYNKHYGTRCYRGTAYSGEAINDSGNTIITLDNGKIVDIKNSKGTYIYNLRCNDTGCFLYINGIYLDELEFENLFPQLAVYFKLKGVEIIPIFKDNLVRLQPPPKPKNPNWSNISGDSDSIFEIGVLHI